MVDMDALRQHASTTDEARTPTWQPEKEGDEIAGRLLGYRTAVVTDKVSGQPRRQSLADLETHQGEYSVWLSVDLHRGLADRSARGGDLVYIRYEGQVDLDDGKRVNRFAVAVCDPNGALRPFTPGGSERQDEIPGQQQLPANNGQPAPQPQQPTQQPQGIAAAAPSGHPSDPQRQATAPPAPTDDDVPF